MRREQYTGRTSEQITALPGSARDEEEAANTGRRNEQRAALPGSARNGKEAANTGR